MRALLLRRPRALELGLAAWLAIMVLAGAYLLAGHTVALPLGDGGSRLQRRLGSPAGRTLALHVLLANCPCSRRVLDHLIARGPSRSAEERVLLVGDEADALAPVLRARGYAVEELRATELQARYGIESAPVLVVRAATGGGYYVGGYTRRKQAAQIHDTEILERIARGESLDALPIFGCAVSARLRAALDPLGLKN